MRSPTPTPAAAWIDLSTPRQNVPSPIGISEPRYGVPAITAWIFGNPLRPSSAATSLGIGTRVPPPPPGVAVSTPSNLRGPRELKAQPLSSWGF